METLWIHKWPGLKRFCGFLTLFFVLVNLIGCVGPYVYTVRKSTSGPLLRNDFAIMDDGYVLPLVISEPDQEPEAVILALHGFNDYSNAFSDLGKYLASRNILLIAYDQRGFGRTEGRGYWHGADRLRNDLLTMVDLIGQRYTNIPLYVLGESMGGAVILVSLDSDELETAVSGVVLVAPAVWAKNTMPWYQRTGMWFFAHVMPWFSLTAKGLQIIPSDNIEMLRALSRDSLVLRDTRADTVYGLSNLMDKALSSSSMLNVPALILYGKHDQIIPKEPTCVMIEDFPSDEPRRWKFILYDDGYHMLTRDLQAINVYRDIEVWILDSRKNGGQRNYGAKKEDIDFVCDSIPKDSLEKLSAK